MSFRIRHSSSADKRSGAPTAAAAGSTSTRGNSSSPLPSQGRRLGASPKGRESPLKQALVIHHANVQNISVTWFKILEQMEAKRKAQEAAASKQATSANSEHPAEGVGHKVVAISMSNSSECSTDMVTEKTLALPASSIGLGETKEGKAKLSQQPRLIHPREVRISHHAVQQEARVVVSPMTDYMECLRRNEEVISDGVRAKKMLISQILDYPIDDMDSLSGSLLANKISTPEGRHFLMASMIQADRLLDCINTSTKVQGNTEACEELVNNNNTSITQDPPGASCRQLAQIVPPLLKHLSNLLHSIKSMEDEMKQSRIALLKCKAEAGSCSSLLRESPQEIGHNNLSAKSSSQSEKIKEDN